MFHSCSGKHCYSWLLSFPFTCNAFLSLGRMKVLFLGGGVVIVHLPIAKVMFKKLCLPIPMRRGVVM